MSSTKTNTTNGKATIKPAKPRPVDACRLTIHIRDVAYSVKPVTSEDGRAWRLRNAENGKVYDVAETEHGPTCDCGDFEYRHNGIDAVGCKHVRALRAVRLIADEPESDPSTWPDWCDQHTYATTR